MQVTETGSEKLRKNYRVVVEASEIVQATETELKTLGQRVKIPGFRPGFVPLKVLQQRYGKSVQADVLKNVISKSTEQIIRQHNLRLSTQPDVNVEDYKEEGDLVFTMAVETMPDMPEIKFEDITLERETFEIEDAAVDQALGVLAENNPSFAPLGEGAKAEEGHVISMDFLGKVDGKAFDGGKAENFRLEIGSGRLIPGFEDQLVGMKVGEAKPVNVTFPENYHSRELAGKPAVFDVTLREIAKKEAAVIDDAFASARGMKDLAALREAVRGQLGKEYHDIVRTRLKKRLFDALEVQCDFPLPDKMVKMEFDAIWGRLQQAKAAGEEDVYEGKPEEEVKAEYQRIAERRVKLGILLAELGQKNKLQVTRDELTRAVMQHAGQFPGQEQAVFDYYRKNPARLDELRGPILEEKAVDWILERVKTKDKKVSTKELAEADAEDLPEAPRPKAKKAKAEDKAEGAEKPAAKKKTAKKKEGEGEE